MKTSAYGAISKDKQLEPVTYETAPMADDSVHVEVHYCGICHSDIHTARDDWHGTFYPCVPGHEITGIVKTVGKNVKKFKAGDKVGVGCYVGSCRDCTYCNQDKEQHCSSMMLSFNSSMPNGDHTKGGYGRDIVVPEHFVLDFSRLDMAKGAPLLCAGITPYSAIRTYGLDKPGMRVGVMGIGGLGHMAVQILKGMGVEPVALSHSPNKKEDAMKLGCVDFILTTDAEKMKLAAGTLDGIVDTVAVEKDWLAYVALLKPEGTLATVGAPALSAKCTIGPFGLIMGSKRLAGGIVGGLKQQQECLDFCADHNIYPWVEMITCDKVNEAYDRTVASQVKYRFVMDIKNSAPAVLP